jgi:hypothetical protein
MKYDKRDKRVEDVNGRGRAGQDRRGDIVLSCT